MIFEEVAICQLVFNWDYYGVNKQMAWHATESFVQNICYFENSERDWRVLDDTVEWGTVCHDIPKSLLVLVSTQIKKVKILNHILRNMGTERFERDYDWYYARGIIHIGFTWNMTVRSSQDDGFNIIWDSIYFVTFYLNKFRKWIVWKCAIYTCTCILNKTKTDHYTVTLNM